MKFLAWSLLTAGLALTALPLYAEVFTKKAVAFDPPVPQIDDSAAGISATQSMAYTTMSVPSWAPLVGGLLVMAGGIAVGKGTRSELSR